MGTIVRGNGTVPVGFDIYGNYEVCFRKDRTYVVSHGVWDGDNPFDFVIPITLLQTFLFVLVSRVVYFVLRPLRTPKFVCSVLGGIIFGPSFLGQNKAFQELLFPAIQAEVLIIIASLGAAFSIFVVAMKMDAYMNIKSTKRTWKFGLIPFLSSFWVMSVLFYLYRPRDYSSVDMQTVGVMLTVTTSVATFPVMSECLLELNLITSELGQIALSSTMLTEVIHWGFITIGNIIKSNQTGHSIPFLLCYGLLVLFCIYIIRPAMLMIARSTPVGKPVREGYVVLILVGVLIVGAISDVLGLSFLQGPLLLGIVMPSGPPLGTTIVEKTETVISEILMPLFFSYVGTSMNVFSIKDWSMIMKMQLIIIGAYLAKVLACMLISLTYRIRLKHGFVLGLMLNLKGIIEVIVFTKMRRVEVIDEQIFTHLIISVLALTSIVSPLIEILYKPHTRLEKSIRHKENYIRTIQSTPRTSEFRIVSCIHKEGEVRSIIALLEACNPSMESPICVFVIHLIELLGKDTPLLRRIDINKGKSVSVNYPNTNFIMRAFDNYSKNSGAGLVTVLPCINVAPYKNMHESICNLAQDQLIPFIIIPFHENDHSHDGGNINAAAIRELNGNFQAYAPCTVGILVDRYSRLGMNASLMNFQLGIFFAGGPDDREALSLGMRMMERENTSIILFRFVLGNEEDEEEERMLDESFIDEFKAKMLGSENVEFQEIFVKAEKIFEAIRSSEGNYDLVIVGKKHNIGTLNDEKMSNFIYNAEMLGMFGDMLASIEFYKGMVPVLVIQCSRQSELQRADSVISHKSFASKFW